MNSKKTGEKKEPSQTERPASHPEQPKQATAKQSKRADEQVTRAITTNRRNKHLALLILLLLVIIAIVLAVVLTRDDGDYDDGEQENPTFATGVSLVTEYHVNATITSRLATTILTIIIENGLDCPTIRGLTMQFPLGARVASLKTLSDDGCATQGIVQPLKETRETFIENVAQGLPGAYVEEQDTSMYSLQVAMPPMGSTKVELIIEELLRQRVGKVDFQVPLTPNDLIDQVKLDIAIHDIGQEQMIPQSTDSSTNATNSSVPAVTGGTSFHLDLNFPGIDSNATDSLHVNIPDAREHELPKVLSGSFTPASLPEDGVLYTDGACFEHFFLPESVEPMPKNIFFLFDISDEYTRNKFQQAKTALKSLIDSLTPSDSLTIQTFAGKATEHLWGKAFGTQQEKVQAKAFVNGLETKCCGADLHAAYLKGLLRAKSDADESGVVTILMMLSNTWASRGVTDRSQIASDVWKLNQEGKVKMFSLGFGDTADTALLNTIAIMNGGVALPLLQGHVDYVTQMERYFESQFGDILLSDVQVMFSGDDANAYGVTRKNFPVLAHGSEIVVRGLLTTQSSSSFQATSAAMTSEGNKTWTATAIQDPFVMVPGLMNSRCFQSYAHSRISQLMVLRDAAELLGDVVLEPVVHLAKPCNKSSLVECIEQEALSLALEANIVEEELTGMVTVDEEACQTSSFGEADEICLEGSSIEGQGSDDDWEQPSMSNSFHHFVSVSVVCLSWIVLAVLAFVI